MGNLYEYLIGGRKTGTRNKPKQFKELVPGDHLYLYNFNPRWKRTNFIDFIIEEPYYSNGPNAISFPAINAETGKKSNPTPSKEGSEYIWSVVDNGGKTYCMMSTEKYPDDDAVELIRKKYFG